MRFCSPTESDLLEGTRIRGDPHSLLFIRVVVRDNGIGMSTEEQEDLFEEFYRAKNEYTLQVPGTGLGLSLVKKLVECHEGAISVQSAPGNGTLFTVSLPIMDKTR